MWAVLRKNGLPGPFRLPSAILTTTEYACPRVETAQAADVEDSHVVPVIREGHQDFVGVPASIDTDEWNCPRTVGQDANRSLRPVEPQQFSHCGFDVTTRLEQGA